MPTKCKLEVTFFKATTIIIFLLSTINFSCKDDQGNKKISGDPLANKIMGMDTAKNRWGSWNVLLKEGTASAARSAAILKFENAILEQIRSNLLYKDYNIRFQVFYCPCDSLLYNIGATLINGAGYTVTSPAPPPPPGGSGDVMFVSVNNHLFDIEDSIYTHTYITDSTQNLNLANNDGKIKYAPQTLAVIDTGIDTSYFSPEIKKLMTDQSIYNVVSGNVLSFFDDHPGRHGTVVTGLALQAVKDRNEDLPPVNGINPLPRLIILKALDRKKEGSTFTVSCAMSYAIQHNATVINESLGYYDYNHSIDSVFRYYVERAKDSAISVFAAAGNFAVVNKVQSSICKEATNANLLDDRRRFYPACFSTDLNNVFTVTTLTNPRASCFYQNYSSTYVTLGVIQKNRDICCHFRIPFAIGEGTSFATPVASGTAISYILNGQNVNNFIGSLRIETTAPQVTKQGQYMIYSSR